MFLTIGGHCLSDSIHNFNSGNLPELKVAFCVGLWWPHGAIEAKRSRAPKECILRRRILIHGPALMGIFNIAGSLHYVFASSCLEIRNVSSTSTFEIALSSDLRLCLRTAHSARVPPLQNLESWTRGCWRSLQEQSRLKSFWIDLACRRVRPSRKSELFSDHIRTTLFLRFYRRKPKTDQFLSK